MEGYTGFCLEGNDKYIPLLFKDRIKVTYKSRKEGKVFVIVDYKVGCKYIAYNEEAPNSYRYLPSIMADYIRKECTIEVLKEES